MANLAIKSHYGPVPVPKNCVLPVPTDPPNNSSSLKFSYKHMAFSMLEMSSQVELAKHHHQTAGSTPKSTFLRSIRDHPLQWKTFPGLSYELIRKHLPPSIATYQGHMIRKRSCYNSTRRNRLGILDARNDVQDVFPTEYVCAITEDDMFIFVMMGNAHTSTLYTGLTGRFPVESYDGMNYMFVAYVYKLNDIVLRSMKTREDANMVTTFKSVCAKLKEKGHKPNLHVLDNKCSKAVKTYFVSEEVPIQIVEADNHRVNACKPAVNSTKYHVISTVATVDKTCTLQLWSRFLPQMQRTLNMFRTSRQNNNLTANKELNGPFDWNATPMAPLGSRATAFIAPNNRNTYVPHTIEAYVTGMAPHHYRLLEMFIPMTRGYRLLGTYRLFPSHWSVPTVYEHDNSIVAATDLLQSFQQVVPTTAENKRKYITAIRSLTAVIGNHPTQETQGSPRVGETPTMTMEPNQPPIVDGGTHHGHHLLDPETIRKTPRIHQRRTRQNVPMPAIMEVAVPPSEVPTQRL